MKHMIALLLIVALIFAFAAPVFADGAAASTDGSYIAVTTHGVNFRDSAGNLIPFLDENGSLTSLITKGHFVRVFAVKDGRAEIEYLGRRGNILASITTEYWRCTVMQAVEQIEESDGRKIQTVPVYADFIALENPAEAKSDYRGERGVIGIYRGERGIVKASCLSMSVAESSKQVAVRYALVTEDANLRRCGNDDMNTNWLATVKAGSVVEYTTLDDAGSRTTVRCGSMTGTLTTSVLKTRFKIEDGQAVYSYEDGVLVGIERKGTAVG